MPHNFGQKNKAFDYSLNKQNTEDEKCILLFSKCDDRYPIWNLNKQELKAFLNFAQKVESLPWRTIKTHDGLNFENLPNLTKPDNIDIDVTLASMRVTQKFRIIGFRQKQFFYIVWFDKNHKTC